MFWKKPDLWQQHAVTLIRRTQNYRMEFVRDRHVTPILDDFIQASAEKFPERDIEARKIGVIGFRQDRDALVLECVPVSWAQYVVSTKVRDKLPISERFHRLAGSCLITTFDGQLILTFRSKRAERYPDVWHVGSAGYVERADISADGSPNPAMLREIEEEVNLPRSEVKGLSILGVCEHHQNAIYEICFSAHTVRTAQRVLADAEHAVDVSEGKLRACSEREVRRMLKRETFNPAGAATLLMHFNL